MQHAFLITTFYIQNIPKNHKKRHDNHAFFIVLNITQNYNLDQMSKMFGDRYQQCQK